MRVVQPLGTRGSLKWIQAAVARRPDLIQPADLPSIQWHSPLAADGFAEYRDGAFLALLGLDRLSGELAAFWPGRGPQWDALGMTNGAPVLVEAKAHVSEFLSPATQAGPDSRKKICEALALVREDLGITDGVDWSTLFYQYTNRLAHLWWLRKQGVPAHLLFVNFLNDADMDGPATPQVWEAAYDVARYALGLPKHHKLSSAIHHVEPDTRELS